MLSKQSAACNTNDVVSDHEPDQHSPPRTIYQQVYGFFGFKKAYNFPLFFVFAGAMLGFSLARIQYLDVGGAFARGAQPGEWYTFKDGSKRIGITLHLACGVPSGILMVFQFVPIIRHKLIIFHRINGYLITVLTFISLIGVFMITRSAFGGAPSTQAAIVTLSVLVLVGLGMAIYNIKRLQIDQHRAWMLRTMFWLGTIITVRLVMVITAAAISKSSKYYASMTCGEIVGIGGYQSLQTDYPQCVNATSWTEVPVVASNVANDARGEVAFQLGFATGMWVAIFVHTIGVEIYLNLTRAESQRLRQVSYQRQLKAGMKFPGSAGLTSDRFGDEEKWTPCAVTEIEL